MANCRVVDFGGFHRLQAAPQSADEMAVGNKGLTLTGYSDSFLLSCEIRPATSRGD
jgi:trehalose/maltose hydrolase-like predicted phosphorylase